MRLCLKKASSAVLQLSKHRHSSLLKSFAKHIIRSLQAMKASAWTSAHGLLCQPVFTAGRYLARWHVVGGNDRIRCLRDANGPCIAESMSIASHWDGLGVILPDERSQRELDYHKARPRRSSLYKQGMMDVLLLPLDPLHVFSLPKNCSLTSDLSGR